MSRIPPALAYLVIYNPTLQPNPEDLTEGRDEDDVTEQAHVLFYTARERAVSRDRILRQVGLAKALANFAEMFTAQPGFDNVHAQKSRLVMISPEPNFWIHACVNVAKTPKTTTKGATLPSADNSDDFDYHDNSLNDEVLRTQLLHAFHAFKLQYGGFTHIMQTEGVRPLERRIEAFFTPWAWQWNVGGTPEFGNYLGLSVHPLKKQLANPIAEYVSCTPDTPTVILSPPHVITGSNLPPISPVLPLSRFLEQLVPPPMPKQPSPSLTTAPSASAPMHMLTASGNAVTKYITKPAAQVVDPRNWGWPTLPFGKGSMRAKGKDRGKIVTTDEAKPETGGSSGNVDSVASEPSHSKEFLGPPVDPEVTSRASRSVSPSTIDHESLLDAQQDNITTAVTNVDFVAIDAASVPLPADSDSDIGSHTESSGANDGNENTESVERIPVTPHTPTKSSISDVHSERGTNCASKAEGHDRETDPDSPHATTEEREHQPTEATLEDLQSTPLATARVALPAEEPAAVRAAPELAAVQVQSLTRVEVETTSGAVHVWLDSPFEDGKGPSGVRRQRVDWIAIPGMLVASVLKEGDEQTWRNAARQLLLSIDETIQARQLTAAETTLRALNTTKVVAHYPATQLSASSSLPQFTSESPYLFSSARALQFATPPAIREIVTHTRSGAWCAARQSTIRTRVYIEVDRKDANLVDVDHELGSACRRWDETDS